MPAEDQQAFAQETLRKRGKWPEEEVQAAAEPPMSAGQRKGSPTQQGSVRISRGREALRDLLLLPLVILAVLLMLLALPILLLMASARAERDRRRLRAAAEVTPCGRCGQPLGLAAVEAADAAWDVFLEGMMAQGLRPRVVRRLFARCPSCGAGHGWDEDHHVLQILPAERWELSAPPR